MWEGWHLVGNQALPSIGLAPCHHFVISFRKKLLLTVKSKSKVLIWCQIIARPPVISLWSFFRNFSAKTEKSLFSLFITKLKTLI